MAGRKFNFGGGSLNTREMTTEESVAGNENRAQQLVENIENAKINTAFEGKMISRSKLVFNKNNDYPIEAVEKVANSILREGLAYNLVVFYDEDTDTYIIDAGEQRTRAFDYLVEKYQDFEDKESLEYKLYLLNVAPLITSGLPCKVCYGSSKLDLYGELTGDVQRELDEIDSMLRIKVTNEIKRDDDPVRKKQALDEIISLRQRKNEILGIKKKFTNKEIGKEFDISERMVQKYKSIDKLIPELQELFREKGITLADGANYANLNEDEQRQILEMIKSGGDKKEIEELYNQLNAVRKEILEKDKELKHLEREKAEAIEQASQAMADAETIEEKLRKELKKENAAQSENDRQHIKILEEQLQNAQADAEKYGAQKKELEQRSAEIEQLKNELAKKNATNSSKEDILIMKAALRVEREVKGLQNTLKELQEAVKDYQKIYDSSEENKSPEEYIREIKCLLENF